jgi:hypothetical protein
VWDVKQDGHVRRPEKHHDAYLSGYSGFEPKSEDLTTMREAKLRELDFGCWDAVLFLPSVQRIGHLV